MQNLTRTQCGPVLNVLNKNKGAKKMMYEVDINMSKVKRRLESNGVKIHLKAKVTVMVTATTPDDACANAINKVCKEIKENKKTQVVENLIKDVKQQISVIKVRPHKKNG